MTKRTLLLTLDAFDTLFHPRLPVPTQYTTAALSHNLPPIPPSTLASSFKTTFKEHSASLPNYGRAEVLRGRYGGPKQWWEEVIRGSFVGALTSLENNKGAGVEVPDALVRELLERFSGKEGYVLCEDVGVSGFLERMRGARRGNGLGVFERVVLGVVSNSDDRISAVLGDLGVRVGSVRADQGVQSGLLPGFKERDVIEERRRREDEVDIDMVITSYEAGEEKPGSRIFEVARRRAEDVFGEAGEWTRVHVGDDLGKDFRGAEGAGWIGYYLSRDEGEGGLEGVRKVNSLVELVDELEKYR